MASENGVEAEGTQESDNDTENDSQETESRELKMETFSGRRRPDRQRNPGTEAAVASRQKSNIKIAVNSEDGAFN